MWKEFTSQRLPPNENSADPGYESDSKNQDSSMASKNSLVSQITNTVWKGITNQTAMEAPPTPPPTTPIHNQFPEPEVEPQTTPNLWSYAEKLKRSDTVATLSKISSNWRARALLGSSAGGTINDARSKRNSHDRIMSSSEKQGSPQMSSPFPLSSSDSPLETTLEGLSQQRNKSLMEKTRSLLSPTRSPPRAPKSAPRQLLLPSTLHTSGQNGLKNHRNLINSTDPEEWADVMREKQHHLYRDSLSSTSSLSPSDAYARTPKSTRSDWESDTSSSRIVSLNRRSISPMAPNFRTARGRVLSRNSSPSSTLSSPPIHPPSPSQENQTTNGELPTISQTCPPPGHNASRTAASEHKEGDNSDTAFNERPSSIIRLTSEDVEMSIKASRLRSKRNPRLPHLQIQDMQKTQTAVEEKPLNSTQLTVEWPRDETEIISTPKGNYFESEQDVSMPRKLSRSPLRSKKLSTGEIERQRKLSMDTIRDSRQRKVSNGHRPRKISTESRDIPKSRRESSAEEGDDEGYDELLSAYESEDGPRSSLESMLLSP